MRNEIRQTLFSISLRARILREWQKANRADDQDFTDRELLTMELISDFAPITEKGLCKIFGLSFSSVSDLIKRLDKKGILDVSEKTRGMPLELTAQGKNVLGKLKETSSARFDYLFQVLTPEEEEVLGDILKRIDTSAEKTIQQLVFDRYSKD